MSKEHGGKTEARRASMLHPCDVCTFTPATPERVFSRDFIYLCDHHCMDIIDFAEETGRLEGIEFTTWEGWKATEHLS
jgi:hypothetical protein